MSTSFAELGLPAGLVAALAARGIADAFPIQSLALPPAMAGHDVCGKAPTGSGKTLAFGIPLALRVSRAEPRRPRGLVLAPTRELAAQIVRELEPLLALRERRVVAVYGGVGMNPQIQAMRRGVDVVVACPGRLADLVREGHCSLRDVELVVLDEADRMADMGFLPEVRRLLDQVRDDRQTLLFSATLDGDVDVLVRRYQHDPVICELEAEEPTEPVTHEFVHTTKDDRVELTKQLVTKYGSTVVFCRTKHGADRLAKQLDRIGVDAVAIHGGRSQGQRDRALAAFRSGAAVALVATDVAARGIHVDDVGCVVHFDVPADHKDYVHRSGRTGRAGAGGVVVTFVTDETADDARKLQRDLGRPSGTAPELAGRGSARGGGKGRGPQPSQRSSQPRGSQPRQAQPRTGATATATKQPRAAAPGATPARGGEAPQPSSRRRRGGGGAGGAGGGRRWGSSARSGRSGS